MNEFMKNSSSFLSLHLTPLFISKMPLTAFFYLPLSPLLKTRQKDARTPHAMIATPPPPPFVEKDLVLVLILVLVLVTVVSRSALFFVFLRWGRGNLFLMGGFLRWGRERGEGRGF